MRKVLFLAIILLSGGLVAGCSSTPIKENILLSEPPPKVLDLGVGGRETLAQRSHWMIYDRQEDATAVEVVFYKPTKNNGQNFFTCDSMAKSETNGHVLYGTVGAFLESRQDYNSRKNNGQNRDHIKWQILIVEYDCNQSMIMVTDLSRRHVEVFLIQVKQDIEYLENILKEL